MNKTNNNNNNLLSKAQYLEVNQQAFSGLSKTIKDQKYQAYVKRYQARNQSIVKSNANKRTNVKNNQNQLSMRKNMSNTIYKNLNSKADNYRFKLSKCLLSYAQASIDPFDNITELPCIPDVITVPSYKFRTYLEADVTIGSAGTGFAVMNPFHMLVNDNASSSSYSDYAVVTTDSTYSTATYNWGPTDIGTIVTGYNPASNLSIVAIAQYAYRLVAAGMEVDYTGVLLNQAGLVSVIQWDGLENIPNPLAISTIRQHPRSQTCPTSREARCYIRYEPVLSSNYDYSGSSLYYPTGRSINYPLGIFISGAEPDTTFRIRAVAFFEVQGLNLPATPSEADPIGFPAFQAARSEVLPTPDPKSDLLSILKKTAGNIMNTVSGFAPVIGTAIGSVFGQPAVGGIVGGLSKDLIQSLFG